MTLKTLVLTPLVLAAAVGLSSCGKGDGAPAGEQGPVVPVKITVAEPVNEPARLDLSGELVARNRIEVATKVAGRILEIPVTEGTPVKTGDVLARLDSPELTSALAQSQAAEEAARIHFETSSRQLERMQRLVKGQVVTPRDVEMTEMEAAGAKASYERAKAMTEMSRRNVEYAVLRAPMNGVVVRRTARAGDLAVPGRPVVVLENPSDLEVRITLPAEMEWPLGPGDRAEVRIPLGNGEPRPAVVDRVVPGADGHTVEAFLRVEDVKAPSGSFVRASLFGADSTGAIRLPDTALIRKGPLTGAFVVRDGRALLRWLRLGPDGRVMAGIDPGDSVVTAPPADLEDGDPVEVR